MAISTLQALMIITFNAYFMWSDAQTLRPWPGWADIHAQWSDIPTSTGASWRSNPTAEPRRWLAIITAFIYLIFMESGKKPQIGFRLALFWMRKGDARQAPADIALRMSSLPDHLTVSQRSEQGPLHSIPSPDTTGAFHRAASMNNPVEMALALDNLEPQAEQVPSSSVSPPAPPKPVHLPSLLSASNGADEWMPEFLYQSGKK